METKSSKQLLQNALTTMKRCKTSNLAESIKSANSLIIKALYEANVEYLDASDFIADNLNFFAPLNAKVSENNHAVQDADVKQWAGTIKRIVLLAKCLCEEPC